MPRKKITFDIVRTLALALPGVKESTMYGSPALKVGGKLLACVPSHKSAEAESVAVCIDFEQRAALLAEAPATYYLPEHYVSSPIVLVRMSTTQVDQLRDLLGASWRFVTKTL